MTNEENNIPSTVIEKLDLNVDEAARKVLLKPLYVGYPCSGRQKWKNDFEYGYPAHQYVFEHLEKATEAGCRYSHLKCCGNYGKSDGSKHILYSNSLGHTWKVHNWQSAKENVRPPVVIKIEDESSLPEVTESNDTNQEVGYNHEDTNTNIDGSSNPSGDDHYGNGDIDSQRLTSGSSTQDDSGNGNNRSDSYSQGLVGNFYKRVRSLFWDNLN